jgi:hypothetical protein
MFAIFTYLFDSVERDTAEQPFVGAVEPVTNQVGGWIKLLNSIGHGVTNTCEFTESA